MAWELSASPTCLPNGPASTRCSGFRRNSSHSNQVSAEQWSPLPGSGISRGEKKGPIGRQNHRSAVSETKWSHKNRTKSEDLARLQDISTIATLRGGPGSCRIRLYDQWLRGKVREFCTFEA